MKLWLRDFRRAGSIRSSAVVLLCLVAPGVSLAQTWRVGPDSFSLRHATLPSILLWKTDASFPELRFFENAKLTGPPVMVLNSDGLKLDGTIICRWATHEGMFGVERATDGSLIRARGCPVDLPISSKVTDGGLGVPALSIVVSSVSAPIGLIRFANRTFYFDLRDLPGDPNPEEDPPPFSLAPKGDVGWNWLESQEVDDARVGATLAKKLEDAEYARFYHGIRKCFLGRDYRCLNDYLHPDFELEPWWGSTNQRIGRRDIGRIAWQTSLWQELAWCFLRGRPVDGAMTFSRGFLMCFVKGHGAKYGLSGCVAGE